MSEEDWGWLNSLGFGCVIFSNPRKGQMSMPERIADGDLDGDWYVVCWDQKLLSYMKADPLPKLKMKDNGVLKTAHNYSEKQCWFDEAQDLMIDGAKRNDIGALTGALYNLGAKIADESPKLLKDDDARACFAAYKNALEYEKHGRPIELPEHLHEKIRSTKLRELLTTIDDTKKREK